MKLSKHSKRRMLERTTFNHQERRNLFRLALTNGKSIEQIKDEKLRRFMMSKKNCQTKIYRDYIFIYSRNSHQLYTMYKLPSYLRDRS